MYIWIWISLHQWWNMITLWTLPLSRFVLKNWGAVAVSLLVLLCTMACGWWKSNWTEKQKEKVNFYGKERGSTCSSIWVCGQPSPGPSFLPLLNSLTTFQCPPHHCLVVLLQHNGQKKRKMQVVNSRPTFVPKPDLTKLLPYYNVTVLLTPQ